MATAASASPAGDPGSTSLGGQYEKLLATVGNLQGDLQRTVGVCQVRVDRVAKLERERCRYKRHVVVKKVQKSNGSFLLSLFETCVSSPPTCYSVGKHCLVFVVPLLLSMCSDTFTSEKKLESSSVLCTYDVQQKKVVELL